MNIRKKIEVNPNEISKKEVFKYLFGISYVHIHNIYIKVKYNIHIVTDFIFKRYVWYRKTRNSFSVRVMTKSHGDARNHAYTGWCMSKIDLEDEWEFERYLKKLQEKYYILEVWAKKEKLDIVKRFKIDENKLKRYSRTDKIDSLLK